MTLHPKETQISYLLYSFQNCSPLACVRFEGSSGSVRSWEGCIVLNKMRAVLKTLFPATQGPSMLQEKRISNNRLVVQGTTQNTLPVWKIQASSEHWIHLLLKRSPLPPASVNQHLIFNFLLFYNVCYRALMCWRWLDIFLIKIYVLNSYQVTKLAKYKEGGFSWVWAKHLQINLLGSLNTGESQHPFDFKAG